MTFWRERIVASRLCIYAAHKDARIRMMKNSPPPGALRVGIRTGVEIRTGGVGIRGYVAQMAVKVVHIC